MKKLNSKGFSHDIVIVVFVVIFAIVGVGYLVASHADQSTIPATITPIGLDPSANQVAVAMDKTGNKWVLENHIANGVAYDELQEVPNGQTVANAPIALGTSLGGSSGEAFLTIDPSNNVWVADQNNGNSIVYELPAGSTTPTRIIPNADADGITSDPSGNIFIADASGRSDIVEIPHGSQTPRPIKLVVSYYNPSQPGSPQIPVVVPTDLQFVNVYSDSSGNIYADAINDGVFKITAAQITTNLFAIPETVTTRTQPYISIPGLAIFDPAGHVWSNNSFSGSGAVGGNDGNHSAVLWEASQADIPAHQVATVPNPENANVTIQGIASDSKGNIWTAVADVNAPPENFLYELPAGSTTFQSPIDLGNYAVQADEGNSPNYSSTETANTLVVDSSGNIWALSDGSNSLLKITPQ